MAPKKKSARSRITTAKRDEHEDVNQEALKKKRAKKDVEDDDDEGPEEVSMSGQRALAEAAASARAEAEQRVLEARKKREERDAAQLAAREQEVAAKLRKQQLRAASQASSQQSDVESPNFLPAELLSVLGRDSPRSAPEEKRTAKQKKDAKKQKQLKAKLSEIWEKNGIELSLDKQQSVEVPLPDSLVQFMNECNDAVERAPVAEKRKRARNSTKTKM